MFEITDHQVWVQSREDLNFPLLASYGDDRFGLFFSRGRHSVGEWAHYLLSEDGCNTWRDDSLSPFGESRRECPEFLFPHLALRNGALMSVVLRRKKTGIAFIRQITSTDHGRTWCESWEPIQSPGAAVYAAHSPVGLTVWGPLVELPSGALLALGSGPTPSQGESAEQNRVIVLERRPDETMWRFKSTIFAPEPDTREGVNETSIAQLPSGRIVGVCRTGYPNSPLLWTTSDDEGSTWKECDTYADTALRGCMEGKIEELKDGRLLMIMRTQLGAVFKSCSEDGGDTWSKPQTTGLRAPESCPGLRRIPQTGDLLIVWNHALFDPMFDHSGLRNPLTVAVSKDEGETWEKIKDIETDPEWEFTNPAMVVTSAGKVIMVYEASKYESLTGSGHGNVGQRGRVGRDRMHLKLARFDLDWLYA